ncbi:DUF6946 family protein [Oleidesulfovibrio sp.]|uniref:DUF6946 family protein n=1 Tax=Oleidesulfovibrio sp. TaxID=2909707 RepID=UPI003A8C17FA
MQRSSKYAIPSSGPEDWRQVLAAPDKHWKTGYSAKELAYSWQNSDGFPVEIQSVLNTCEELASATLLLAIPEYKVALPGSNIAPSQNDLFVLARTDSELVVIMVEGKAEEPFGPTLREWQINSSAGKQNRLAYLQSVLHLKQPVPDTIRYQLLHRMASPLIVAQQFHATKAVMLVHSFSAATKWFEDYATLLHLYNVEAQCDVLHPILSTGETNLYAGWVTGASKSTDVA